MSDEFIPQSTAESIPAADIRADTADGKLTTTRTLAVKQPQEDQNDFVVYVYASKLHKCRRKLQSIKEASFPIAEVLLGIATSCFGATAGALTTDMKLDSDKGILFFIALPIIAVACSVAFFFFRHYTIKSSAQIASDVLDELPDPDRTL